jgi:hypothetical protein
VYALAATATVAFVEPRWTAEVSYQSPGGSASFAERVGVKFTSLSPALELMPYWDGPAPAGLPNGSPCGDGSVCASGKCYRFGDVAGFCGQCDDDADCPTGYGCNPPQPGPDNAGSVCRAGALGDGCQTTAICNTGMTCASVAQSNSGFAVKGCSTCGDPTPACGSGKTCVPVVNWDQGKAYRTCVNVGSVALGGLCDVASDCTTGVCAPFAFPDGSTVRVCSECLNNAACGAGEVCSGVTLNFDHANPFQPAVCESP